MEARVPHRHRTAGGTSAQEFNDVNIFLDNDEDGILDAADDVQADESFDSIAMSLTYDNNGNCTSDGVHSYTYDAWNRLRKAQRSASGDTTTIATYTYLADNRRISKVVEKCGPEETANDGGNTTVRYYYGGVAARAPHGRWNILETRNGSNQTTRQWVYGTQYIDEPLLMDVNGDPTDTNDCNPDVSGGESDTDRRYAYVQDRNWNVTAVLETDDGTGTAGRVEERYAYTPYGEFIIIKGDAGSGQLGNVLVTSSVANPLAHQGLPFDQDKGSYQNRWREYAAGFQRFGQHDPEQYGESLNLYVRLLGQPTGNVDPLGLSLTRTDPWERPTPTIITMPSCEQERGEPPYGYRWARVGGTCVLVPNNQGSCEARYGPPPPGYRWVVAGPYCLLEYLEDPFKPDYAPSVAECGKRQAAAVKWASLRSLECQAPQRLQEICEPLCERCVGEWYDTCMRICAMNHRDACDSLFQHTVHLIRYDFCECMKEGGHTATSVYQNSCPPQPPPSAPRRVPLPDCAVNPTGP